MLNYTNSSLLIRRKRKLLYKVVMSYYWNWRSLNYGLKKRSEWREYMLVNGDNMGTIWGRDGVPIAGGRCIYFS